MGLSFEFDHTVRSYELDLLGHVNNAVFVNWIEHARLAAFETLGYPVAGLLRGEWLNNVVHVEIDYRRPAHHGDRVVVTTRLAEVGRTSLTLAHRVARRDDPPDARPLARARVVVVWLSVDDGRPIPVPDEMRARVGEVKEDSGP